MRTVSARDANQKFSTLLAEAASGEEVVITRHGKPVAKLVPVTDRQAPRADAEREAAIRRMVERMRKGVHLGGVKVDRDEIYDR